ncbi:MAG: cupin domain-containing protein [Pirellulaceae bacterium]|jgi:cupin 2 domain-containing protein|nr:cupin domain-containing protein [Pirellulaceae bacterium]MDP7020114.1 cupin domain-containing protein [Pirellulaceae bacterium]
MNNLFSDPPSRLPQELTDVLYASSVVRIERIVSTGQSSEPGFWYDQAENEWVVVLRGHAVLAFDDGSTVELTAGDYIHIPAHRRHRVESTSNSQPTVWLAVFSAAEGDD